MRSASLPHRMTLLVLREANQPVKQIQVSKPFVIAVPIAALLSISGLIISLQMQSGHTISRLEDTLRLQNLKFEAIVTDKNEAIQRLQSQVITLSGQSKELMDRMERVSELEAELQSFIDKYGSKGDAGKLSSLSSLSLDESLGRGGEFIAVHDQEIEELAQETSDDFLEISAMLDEIEKNVPTTLQKAKQTQYSISGTPSEWPTLSTRLTSNFGYRTDPFTGKAAFHAGIDIAGKIGDPVYAVAAGKVIAAESNRSRGKYIIIQHPNGLQSWYMHLSEIKVSEGDTVKKGQTIAKMGNSGRSTGPHLHFEIVKGDKKVNPLSYLQ
ncbi:M23 family metallopeptidase [Paenibacillus woosongensis]|uniref:Peptidoglycan DD-metalloendopeptidase family protein n=1 Tax=Paenibacillus woosongensis TaxID=307580 RepID=A0A7X2Z1W6_9BACL|nr:M23 family metallopeptidase [Paenibacillus woosongensis]MUG45993.1 peptidoglycan DD-metalloendopeptidase family protein [Paenibacillus woosongensis]